jgi:hypothetical protein
VAEQRDGDTQGGLASTKQQLATAARLEAVRRSPATAGGSAMLLEADFMVFTKLPLTQFYKLLSNFLQKLKICKNKTCSIFKVVQLSQYKLF